MSAFPQYRGNFGDNVANTGSNPSPYIWGDCPWDSIESGKIRGYTRWFDFDRFKASSNVNAAEAYWAEGFNVFGSDGAPVTLGSNSTVGAPAFGTVTIGSDGDNEGASIRQSQANLMITGPNATSTSRSGKLWMEARIKSSTITDTKHGIFCGLMDTTAVSATVPIAAAGTLADVNLVGFHRLEGDGDYLDCVYKANGVTAVTVEADSQVLVADTYVKVGMVYNPSTYVLTFYGNGIALCTKEVPAAAGTDFPNDVQLGFVFAVLNATASTPGTSTIDWVKLAQTV